MTVKYPSIEQFRNVIRRVKEVTNYDGKDESGIPKWVDRIQPTITFKGTVKLHGTNSAVRSVYGEPLEFQSRERDLSLTSDNCGFMLWASSKSDLFEEIFSNIRKKIANNTATVVIFGEFVGMNIQKGVAVSQIPKTFIIFDIKIIDSRGDSFWFHNTDWFG